MLPTAYIGRFGAEAPFAGPRSLRLPQLFWLFRLAVMVEGGCSMSGALQGRSSPVGTAGCLGGIWSLACVPQMVNIPAPWEIIETLTTVW